MNSLLILLQATGQPKGMGTSLWLMIGMIVLLWIVMMRPQRKKAKEEQKFRAGLQKGDRVVFSGGIYGKVHSVEENTVDVEVSNGVVLTVEKAMIQPAPEEKTQQEKK
ncbi:MAG: preprotein translocase subunit YajC [Bacteroidales bacterium]|jgi:preprotein translocase subunit YajC|nr:preprotein translocase subunit YajC [Bacteroidales bacterium]